MKHTAGLLQKRRTTLLESRNAHLVSGSDQEKEPWDGVDAPCSVQTGTGSYSEMRSGARKVTGRYFLFSFYLLEARSIIDLWGAQKAKFWCSKCQGRGRPWWIGFHLNFDLLLFTRVEVHVNPGLAVRTEVDKNYPLMRTYFW